MNDWVQWWLSAKLREKKTVHVQNILHVCLLQRRDVLLAMKSEIISWNVDARTEKCVCFHEENVSFVQDVHALWRTGKCKTLKTKVRFPLVWVWMKLRWPTQDEAGKMTQSVSSVRKQTSITYTISWQRDFLQIAPSLRTSRRAAVKVTRRRHLTRSLSRLRRTCVNHYSLFWMSAPISHFRAKDEAVRVEAWATLL